MRLIPFQLPDLIHGDLDSLSPSTSEFYTNNGVKITKDEDQYSTDFGKCMKIITNGYPPDSPYETPNAITASSTCTKEEHHDIIILSTLAGRVDQGLGVLHELLRESLKPRSKNRPPVRLWLLTDQSLTFLLLPGKFNINPSPPRKTSS